MPAEKSAPELAAQLAEALARNAELQAALARQTPALHPPSFILESITDAFIALDREFRYIWVNAEAERLMGMARTEVLGRTLWELFPAVVGSVLEEKCRLAIAENSTQEFENFYAPWNRWYFNKAYPTNEGGLAIYWRDITEKKRLQADLRRQAAILEQVHDSIIATDLQGTITQWNRGAEEMFGYTAAETIGQSVQLLYFEEDRSRVESTVLDPLLREGRLELGLRNRRKSGEECFIRISLSLLRDEGNRPYGMLGVATDITAQVRAERALRTSEERYRGLANAMPQVAYITGADGRANLINEQWQRYSGCSAEQCLDLNWLEWVHPDDVAPLTARWARCLETGELYEREYRLRDAKGEYRWHLGRAVPVRGADGTILQWVGTATDIHALKQAEENLQRSEERFRLASKALGGVVYDWDLQTGRLYGCGDLERIHGIAGKEALTTQTWLEQRVHPDDEHKSRLSVQRRQGRDQDSYETEYRVLHPDGSWVHVADSGHVVRDENRKPVRALGTTRDITAQKRLERDLSESNARMRFQADILATTNDAVIAVDSALCVTYMSRGAERMYGVPSAEALGEPLSSVTRYLWLSPEDERQAWSDIAEKGAWKGENIHVRRDGTRMFVSATVNVLSPEFGGGMVAVIRDISDRKRAELEIQKQAVDLKRANQDLLHFAYAVSHDLHAPLRTLTTFSQLIVVKYKGRLDEEADHFLRLIVEASDRMEIMIRDLLEFARAAGEEQTLDEVSLEEALTTALGSLKSEVTATGASISHSPLPIVTGHAGQFAQLFQNLIGNSLKYRKPEVAPELHISAERRGDEWLVSVRDNGIGFEAEHAEKIFDVFTRLHGPEYSGTGVGLAICKRIVERRGGTIRASATPGEGAIFSFSIPDI